MTRPARPAARILLNAPAMNTIPRLVNYNDADGRPVCPTCGRAILAAQGVVRIEDCMIHAICYPEAVDAETPCEPTR